MVVARSPARILVVDDDPAMLKATARALGQPDWAVDACDTSADALGLLMRRSYAVVVADYAMPGMNGIELCRHVRDVSADTACVLVTGHADLSVAAEAINRANVYRFLTKPWERSDLRAAVKDAAEQNRMRLEHRRFSALLANRNVELQDMTRVLDAEVQGRTTALLLGLINALDFRDTETQGHSRRVALYARRHAEQLGLEPRAVLEIERGALLHDVGKIGVSDTILLKPGKLTDEEWVEMRKHSLHGYHILAGVDFLGGARDMVRSHHERFDGKGYPDGLAGDAIPLGARIFGVIDTYDAMTTDRPYRKALSAEAARAEIEKSRGTQLDPGCADAFLAIPQADLDDLRELVAASPTAGLD
ncbi:MAG: response regulator [Polyangiaceae bacterium]|nr:response regulator [Polyangiaceae bacterium]